MHITDIHPLTLLYLPLAERKSLPDCSAIYFVVRGRENSSKPDCLHSQQGNQRPAKAKELSNRKDGGESIALADITQPSHRCYWVSDRNGPTALRFTS
jgi:hypothetical protein